MVACTAFDGSALQELACNTAADCPTGLVCAEGFCVSDPDAEPADLNGDGTGDGTADTGDMPPADLDLGDVDIDQGLDLGDMPRDQTTDQPQDADIPGGAPQDAPLGIYPLNGDKTGSVHNAGARRPTFVWEAVAGATNYQIQLSSDCAPTEVRGCTLPNPLTESTSETELRWPTALPVATTAPVGRRYYWRVRGCNTNGCGPYGPNRYVDVGRLWSDADGDGYGDIVVGEETAPCGGGALNCHRVHTYFGDATVSMTREIGPARNTSASEPGFAVAYAGDVDADGYGDYVFGDQGDMFDRGSLFVFTGVNLDSLFGGSSTGQRLGLGVSRAYDFDADGYGDVVATSGSGTDIFGQPDVGVTAFNGDAANNQEFPREVERFLFTGASSIDIPVTAGDVTGDGRVDLVVGKADESGGDGRFYVYKMGPNNDWQIMPDSLWVNFVTENGTDVITARLTPNDRHADIASGAPGTDGNAGAVIFHLRTESGNDLFTLDSPAPGARFGVALAAGDVNGDGYDDVAIGAPGGGSGRVYVVAGGTATPSITWTVSGQTGDNFGRDVSFLDANGDGFADLVVGAPGRGSGGAFLVFRGSASGLETTAAVTVLAPEPEYDDFGSKIAR